MGLLAVPCPGSLEAEVVLRPFGKAVGLVAPAVAGLLGPSGNVGNFLPEPGLYIAACCFKDSHFFFSSSSLFFFLSSKANRLSSFFFFLSSICLFRCCLTFS